MHWPWPATSWATQLAAWRPVIDAGVAGLGMIECSAVVAVGAASDLVQRGPVPPNVRVCSHVPQSLLLECCDLFVHHGGFNSVREALRLAVPMVIIPWMNDSGVNAARCEAAGVARLLDRVGLSPVTVGEVCAEVLTDPAYRGAAKGMQRRILALPSVDILITDLESLVRASSPGPPAGAFSVGGAAAADVVDRTGGEAAFV
jgi:N-glycosyltransferase